MNIIISLIWILTLQTTPAKPIPPIEKVATPLQTAIIEADRIVAKAKIKRLFNGFTKQAIDKKKEEVKRCKQSVMIARTLKGLYWAVVPIESLSVNDAGHIVLNSAAKVRNSGMVQFKMILDESSEIRQLEIEAEKLRYRTKLKTIDRYKGHDEAKRKANKDIVRQARHKERKAKQLRSKLGQSAIAPERKRWERVEIIIEVTEQMANRINMSKLAGAPTAKLFFTIDDFDIDTEGRQVDIPPVINRLHCTLKEVEKRFRLPKP